MADQRSEFSRCSEKLFDASEVEQGEESFFWLFFFPHSSVNKHLKQIHSTLIK